MARKSLYDRTPGLLSSLICPSPFSEVRPYRTTRYMSISLNGPHGFILPCLCSYLEFSLLHPNAPRSPRKLFIFGGSSRAPALRSPSRPIQVESIIPCFVMPLYWTHALSPCLPYPRGMICFPDPLSLSL